jgi:hypothetical protein
MQGVRLERMTIATFAGRLAAIALVYTRLRQLKEALTRFLKNKLSGYELSYYTKDNKIFSELTLCCIFKPDMQEDIDYINRFSFKLNPQV